MTEKNLISEFNLRKYKDDGFALVDGSESLANVKQQVISFQLESTQKPVYFKAFITTFSDTYSPNYNSTQVFGRTDPIHVYQNTSREISLAFDIPAASEGEAFENLGRVQKLIRMLYPGYADIENASTLTEAPLVRVKVMNLLSREDAMVPKSPPKAKQGTKKEEKQTFNKYFTKYRSVSDPGKGTLGVIKSCTFQHNLENPQHGVFPKDTNTILPKTISVNISFTPFHEERIGRAIESSKEEGGGYTVASGGGISKTFPYGVDLGDDADAKVQPAGLSRTKAEDLRKTAEKARRKAASAQQNLDKQQAKYLKVTSRLNSAEAGSKKRERLQNKQRKMVESGVAKYGSDSRAGIDKYYEEENKALAAEQTYQDYIQ